MRCITCKSVTSSSLAHVTNAPKRGECVAHVISTWHLDTHADGLCLRFVLSIRDTGKPTGLWRCRHLLLCALACMIRVSFECNTHAHVVHATRELSR